MKNKFFLLLTSLLLIQTAFADNSVTITDAWARKTISPNNNTAAYMKISNNSDKDIKIIGASAAEVANNLELHKSFIDENGISRMVAIDKIIVPARTIVELLPGSIHIMIYDLKRHLKVGEKFNIKIEIEEFDRPLKVQAEVK